MPPPQNRRTSNKKAEKPSANARTNRARPDNRKPDELASSIPVELQQLVLNIFKNAFTDRFETDFNLLLQEVKGHLYNRDFLAAFGRDDYLEVYAARWSPSRALGYLQVFSDLSEELFALPYYSSDDKSTETWKTVCLGGGAGAEVVALGGFLHLIGRPRNENSARFKKLEIHAIDIANWSKIVQTLGTNMVVAPPLSRYASATAKAANAPLLEEANITVTPHQSDVLTTPFKELSPLMKDANLITLMFTLNELYSSSISLTQKFLLNLTACLQKGALLLVVDSPGSYSTVSLNGTEKMYPMKWLLDHTLMKTEDGKEDRKDWAKVLEHESQWFRLPPGLRYPIDLENMRFQLHLYRKET